MGLMYVAPAIIIVALVLAFPLLYTFFLSFHKNNLFTAGNEFAGFSQFVKLIKDPIFVLTIKNTLIWTVGCVVLQFILGTIAAIAINQQYVKGKTLIRILIMVPWVLPSIVGVKVWEWSYHPDFGIINHFLMSTGIISNSITWLSGVEIALWSVIIVNVWKMFPFVMLMVEAALQGVPNELKEAARMDGAKAIRTFFTVTVPHIYSTLLTIILLLTIWTFNAFTFIYVLTQGGPAHKSEILSMYIYRQAFQNYDFGFASTASVVLFLIILFFSVIYIKFFMGKEANQ